MPVPPDVPRPVAKLLGMPENLTVTAVFRLRVTADEVILVMQSCTHGVPYGDYIRVEDILQLKRSPSGVALQKWTIPQWVKPLPWTHGIVRVFTEKKVLSEARSGALVLERILASLK